MRAVASKVTARIMTTINKLLTEMSPRRHGDACQVWGKLAFFQFLLHDICKQVIQTFIEFLDNVHVA